LNEILSAIENQNIEWNSVSRVPCETEEEVIHDKPVCHGEKIASYVFPSGIVGDHMIMRQKSVLFALLLLLSVTNLLSGQWDEVTKGLYYGEFSSANQSGADDPKITVIKIDPQVYALKLLCAGDLNHSALTARQWCRKYDLVGCINAGMFQTDNRTHAGYMKDFDYVNNGRIHSKYQSVAAFNPVDTSASPFYIYDMDESDISGITDRYHTVIQNLRLIKRPSVNCWSQQNKMWSEAALGQDREGNVLFIFSRKPYSMHDLNRILISLSIDLVCAQHLEGGPEASLYLQTGDVTIEKMGSYETGFNENDHNRHFWPVPNVIGIVKRSNTDIGGIPFNWL
jgi:hypothetical protein